MPAGMQPALPPADSAAFLFLSVLQQGKNIIHKIRRSVTDFYGPVMTVNHPNSDRIRGNGFTLPEDRVR